MGSIETRESMRYKTTVFHDGSLLSVADSASWSGLGYSRDGRREWRAEDARVCKRGRDRRLGVGCRREGKKKKKSG